MDNFTPLKPKHQKKSGKFFLIINIFLLLILVFFTSYYMTRRLISTRNKAAGGAPQEEITEGICSVTQKNNGWVQCGSGVGDPKCTFCLKVRNKTCNQVLAERGCGTYYGGSLSGTPSSDKNCTRLNNKCFKCTNNSGGPAYHYKCDRITNLGKGCQDNGVFLGNFSSGTREFCFDGNPDDCGSEQIDWGGVFISRIGSVSCNGTNVNPTNTPTPTKTLTPTLVNSPTPTNIPVITNTPTITQTFTPTTPSNQPTNTLTPTEIIIAQTTSTPTTQVIIATQTPAPPVSGSVTVKSVLMYVLPLVVIVLGIIL